MSITIWTRPYRIVAVTLHISMLKIQAVAMLCVMAGEMLHFMSKKSFVIRLIGQPCRPPRLILLLCVCFALHTSGYYPLSPAYGASNASNMHLKGACQMREREGVRHGCNHV